MKGVVWLKILFGSILLPILTFCCVVWHFGAARASHNALPQLAAQHYSPTALTARAVRTGLAPNLLTCVWVQDEVR